MINTIPILDKVSPEVLMFVEYKIAKKHLHQTVDETVKKHSLPNINYNYFWNLEINICEANKQLRGW